MKKNFVTGFAILLPAVITFWLVSFFIHLLTDPFIGATSLILNRFGIHFISYEAQLLISRFVILLILIALMFVTGFMARVFFINFFFKLGDTLIHKIPVIRKIYKASQEIVKTIFGSEKKTFAQVVLVPFPNHKGYSLGMLTGAKIPEESDAAYRDKISVFVPGTPNPTMGFMLLFNKNEVIHLDMSVESAIKFIVSCGVMDIEFKQTEEASNKAE